MKSDDHKDSPQVDVSLVLACYNAANYLEESFIQIVEVLSHTKFSYEIIMVDDKSKDRTAAIIKKLQKNYLNVKTIFHRHNAGRGKTVYDGFRLSKGRIIGFIDVDLDNPARYIFPLVLTLEQGYADVCTAKRIYLLKKNPYLVLRWILSRGYSTLVKWLLGIKIQDTETGCKFFLRKKIMPILKTVKTRGWFWDTEVMTRCYFKRMRIFEMPTLFIRTSKMSTVEIVPDIWKYIINLINFRKEVAYLKEEYDYHIHRSHREGIVLNQ